MLASGGDDSLVLVWDLLNPSNAAQISGMDASGLRSRGDGGGGMAGSGSNVHNAPGQQAAAGANQGTVQQKGPCASWKCDYEVGNLSWAPTSALTGQGAEWIGVSGGRGVWGVKL